MSIVINGKSYNITENEQFCCMIQGRPLSDAWAYPKDCAQPTESEEYEYRRALIMWYGLSDQDKKDIANANDKKERKDYNG